MLSCRDAQHERTTTYGNFNMIGKDRVVSVGSIYEWMRRTVAFDLKSKARWGNLKDDFSSAGQVFPITTLQHTRKRTLRTIAHLFLHRDFIHCLHVLGFDVSRDKVL